LVKTTRYRLRATHHAVAEISLRKR
jgi:hypothetical protein